MPAQLRSSSARLHGKNMLCQIPRLHLACNTVKAKGSAGRIDEMKITEFEHDKRKEILKMEQIIQQQAKQLARAFEGTDKFKPYVAKW